LFSDEPDASVAEAVIAVSFFVFVWVNRSAMQDIGVMFTLFAICYPDFQHRVAD
jgi:hypothetical protein